MMPRAERLPLALAAFMLGLLVAGRLFVVAVKGPTLTDGDVDSWLRLSIVADLLRSHDWYSHLVARLTPPLGMVTPWTRPLDLVLLALASPFLFFTNAHQALLYGSAFLAPVCLLLIFCLLTRMYRDWGGEKGLYPLLLFTGTAPLMQAYFVAGNADHHCLLALIFTCVLCRMSAGEPSPRGHGVLGLALGLGLWISPEFAAPVAVIFGWWGMRWIAGHGSARGPVLASIAMTVLLALALPLEHPVREWGIVAYDTLSLVHTALGALAIGVWLILLGAEPHFPTQRARLAVAATASIAAGFEALVMFPHLLEGPIAAADPFMRTHFLTSIAEMRPLYDHLPLTSLCMALVGLAAILGGQDAWRQADRERRWRIALIVGAGLFFLAATFLHRRWIYYAVPPLALGLAAFLETRLLKAASAWRMMLLFLLPLIPGAAFWIDPRLFPSTIEPLAFDQACYDDAVIGLMDGTLVPPGLRQPPPTLYLPADLASLVLFQTPYAMIAGNYHRDLDGFRDYVTFGQALDDEAAHRLLSRHGVRVLLFCRSWAQPGNYFARLLSHPPSWAHPRTISHQQASAVFTVDP